MKPKALVRLARVYKSDYYYPLIYQKEGKVTIREEMNNHVHSDEHGDPQQNVRSVGLQIFLIVARINTPAKSLQLTQFALKMLQSIGAHAILPKSTS